MIKENHMTKTKIGLVVRKEFPLKDQQPVQIEAKKSSAKIVDKATHDKFVSNLFALLA